MTWLLANKGTLIVSLLLLLAVGRIVYALLKKRKTGQSSCGCSCGSCPMGKTCHRI